MKRTSTTKRSAGSDDAAKLTSAQLNSAEFRVVGKVVSKAQWQAVVRAQLLKVER